MTPEMKKELQHFLSCADRLMSDLSSKVELAKFMLAESEKPKAWMPTFPASMPAGLLDVQASMAIMNYLQSTEIMGQLKSANSSHPLTRR